MDTYCFYYDNEHREFKSITYSKYVDNIYSKYYLHLEQEKLLYYDESFRIPMEAVVNTDNENRKGFRRKGNREYSGYKRRGSGEGLKHSLYKRAFSKLEKMVIKVNEVDVTLFIDESLPEEPVMCNGRGYIVDLRVVLSKTEPEEYFDMFGGEIWFEIYHTCKVDAKQAVDFGIEGKTLYEFKIPDDEYRIKSKTLSVSGYEKWLRIISNDYKNKCIDGVFICSAVTEAKTVFSRDNYGNIICWINDHRVKIGKCNYHPEITPYFITIDSERSRTYYNGRPFMTEEDALKNAQYLVFRLFNDGKMPNE